MAQGSSCSLPGRCKRVRSKRVRSVAIATVVAAGLALVVSACGGGGGGGTSGTTTSGSGAGLSTATYPTLNVVWGTTDYMDPGLSYRFKSWSMLQSTNLSLISTQAF